MANRVGQQLGNYKLEKLLGEGGFAEVYLAEHIHLKHKKAIKVLRTILSEQEGVSFRTEAQRLAQLTHPHIIPILDFDEREGFPYLVMEYAPNGTLRDRHPKGSRVPLPTIVAYVQQVASALQYIHSQKLIHRDVKPENMLLGLDGKILLSDVGIAVVAHSEYSQRTQQTTGTPYYMAPEQFRGKAEPASDQYSLGVVVYEWIGGVLPFSEGDSLQLGFQHAFEPPPPLRSNAPTVSPDVEKVVMTTLSKTPQERFLSIQAFATALENASRTKPVAQPITQLYPTPPIPPTQKVVQSQAAASPVFPKKQEPVITPPPKQEGIATPPPVKAIDKDALYREGLEAKSRGDLERAASLWKQILDQDRNYGNGTLATQMQRLPDEIRQQQINRLKQQAQEAQKAKDFEREAVIWQEVQKLHSKDYEADSRLLLLNKELRERRIKSLRQQAKEAHKRGMWTQEVEAWKELLRLSPGDIFVYKHIEDYLLKQAREARNKGEWLVEIDVLNELNKVFAELPDLNQKLRPQTRMDIEYSIQEAKKNQKFVWMYENAIQLVKDGNYDAAKTLLKDLWTHAPSYGDPAQLAKSLGIEVPYRLKSLY